MGQLLIKYEAIISRTYTLARFVVAALLAVSLPACISGADDPNPGGPSYQHYTVERAIAPDLSINTKAEAELRNLGDKLPEPGPSVLLNGNEMTGYGGVSDWQFSQYSADIKPGRGYTFTVKDSHGALLASATIRTQDNDIVLDIPLSHSHLEDLVVRWNYLDTTATSTLLFSYISVYDGNIHNLRRYILTGHSPMDSIIIPKYAIPQCCVTALIVKLESTRHAPVDQNLTMEGSVDAYFSVERYIDYR